MTGIGSKRAGAGAGWRVGVDVGGTFTDVVAIRPKSSETRIAKVATRPGDRIAGLLSALAAVGLDWTEVGDLIHGTTMITNAIIEGRLARRGFSSPVSRTRSVSDRSSPFSCTGR